ncbi:MAG: ATP-binding protein [Tissierellia bacterium]|nr:ATP-binding protein [Tissierellia bacterium]
MNVIGLTNQQEFYIGSNERNFRINEYLIIEDRKMGDLIGEVVEANTFNRYIPMSLQQDFVDKAVLESLKAIGYNIDEETIYVAKVRLLNEAIYPVETGSDVRLPKFYELKDILIKGKPESGLTLAAIKNTDTLYEDLDEELKNIYTLYDNEYRIQEEVPFILDLKSLHQYPHIGVFGGSGSGKSYGLRVILEELMKKGIPTIVLDPHYEMSFEANTKNPFSEDYSNKYVNLRIGTDIGVKFEHLNTGELKNLLSTASNLTEAMSAVVDTLHSGRVGYTEFYQRLTDLSEAYDIGSEEEIRNRIANCQNSQERFRYNRILDTFTKFGKQCNKHSINGIIWRLAKLDRSGIFAKDDIPIIEALSNGKLAVIQGDTMIIAVFGTYILNKLYHMRRDYKDAMYLNINADYFPPFMVVTDEAHNFAPKAYDSPSKKIIKEIAQEGRKYGVFLALATQRPALLDETVTAQLNSKFIFRTVRASDINTIREETDLTPEEGRRLPYLRSGDVFASMAIMGRTFSLRIRAAETKSPHSINPFDEIIQKKLEDNDEFLNKIKEYLPISEYDVLKIQKELGKNRVSYSKDEIIMKLNSLCDQNILEKENDFLGYIYKLK